MKQYYFGEYKVFRKFSIDDEENGNVHFELTPEFLKFFRGDPGMVFMEFMASFRQNHEKETTDFMALLLARVVGGCEEGMLEIFGVYKELKDEDWCFFENGRISASK